MVAVIVFHHGEIPVTDQGDQINPLPHQPVHLSSEKVSFFFEEDSKFLRRLVKLRGGIEQF
jgi:hypothetical protein